MGETVPGRVIDLYAGPGGWDEGMRRIGITDVLGIEIEANACATAETAGHKRLRADISTLNPADVAAGALGVIAAPPCGPWSKSGKRDGEKDRAKVHALIDSYADGSDDIGVGWVDPRSHHAAQPVRWVRDVRPTWVCMEQVPPVLPLWQHVAERLRRWGYSTWTGILHSEQYGVPQTRERAVLMARLDGPVHPPIPTHSRYYCRTPERLDLGVPPWVSMGQALGWAEGVVGFPRRIEPGIGKVITIDGIDYRARDLRPTDRPAQVVTEKARSWSHWQFVREGERERSSRVTVQEAGVLQSFPAGYPWQGSKTAQFLQIGNSTPPLLAAHIVTAVTS